MSRIMKITLTTVRTEFGDSNIVSYFCYFALELLNVYNFYQSLDDSANFILVKIFVSKEKLINLGKRFLFNPHNRTRTFL